MKRPNLWFGIAAAFFGAGVACIEIGVKVYSGQYEDPLEKAFKSETTDPKVPSGVSGDNS